MKLSKLSYYDRCDFTYVYLTFMLFFAGVNLQVATAQIIDCPPNIIIDCKHNFYQPKIHLELVQDDFGKGDIIDVVVVADDFSYVSSMQFTLTFNPYLLELVDIPEESLKPVLINDSNAAQGNVAIIWFNGLATGICLNEGSTMFRVQFKILEVKGVENLIQVTDNIAEKEFGITLDINKPSCARSFEVDPIELNHSCPEFCVDVDICQADFVSGNTEVNFEICGGAAPYSISVDGLPDMVADDDEIVSFTIENIFSETSFLFSIIESDGTQNDTLLTFNPVIGVDVNTTIVHPSCNTIANGTVTVNSISSGISNNLDDFQFQWSGGFYNTTELNNLSNGTYFLTITDPFGCEHIKSYELFTEGLELFNLETTTACDTEGKISFEYIVNNPLDDINQILVRDQGFINYPNETALENRYFNNDLPPGIYTISIFTDSGCSLDTTFFLLGDVTRIGGTVWIDEDQDGFQNDEQVLEGIPVSIYNCGETSGEPLATALTNEAGEFAYFVNDGAYQFAIDASLFDADGKLALFQIKGEVSSANNQIDHDNNLFFETELASIAGITECVFVDCPHYITDISEDMSIDLAVIMATCDDPDPQPTFFKSSCDEINLHLENNAICDLSMLNGYCGVMNEQNPVTDFTPYCIANETADNIEWFAFYAPEGDVLIEINPIGCFPGREGALGIHAGIFADCSLSNMVWCSSDNCIPSILSTPLNVLVPGELYYMFIDGCSGSVCNYELSVTCLAGDCSLPTEENIIPFPPIEVCGPNEIMPSTLDGNGNVINWPTAISIQANQSDSHVSFNLQDTIISACGVADIYTIDVTVLVDTSATAPLVACDESTDSIVFSWLPTENTDAYEVIVITGPQAGIYDAINLTYTVNGLSPEETVEISVTSLTDAICGNNAITTISCTSSPSSIDASLLNQIKVFPNPAYEVLHIEGTNIDLSQAIFKLSNINGAIIQSELSHAQNDISNLSPGIYILSIALDDRQAYFKFVKT